MVINMSKMITSGYPIKSFNGITVNTSLPCDSRNCYSYSSRNVKYIVIHYTGNPSDTAKANAGYFKGGSRGASAHYFVDDTSCYQSVALNNAAWAVGGVKKYKHADCRNKNSVSIEMCCSGNYRVSEKTEINAAYLCAALCRYIGITADTVDKYVLRHWDVWAKECPRGWTGNNNSRWNGFKARVKAILNGESEDLTMAQYDELKAENKALTERVAALERAAHKTDWIKDMPDWAKPTVEKLYNAGYLKGGTGGGLALSEDMIRILVVLDRSGVLK